MILIMIQLMFLVSIKSPPVVQRLGISVHQGPVVQSPINEANPG